MDNFFEILERISMHPEIVLIGALTLIEIAPIKINPWKKFFKWAGKMINGEISERLSDLQRDFEQTKAQDKRWHILSFANSCRNGKQHSREEWKHAISELREYEQYTAEKNIENGVIEEDAKYLRELYRVRNIRNDFCK